VTRAVQTPTGLHVRVVRGEDMVQSSILARMQAVNTGTTQL